VPTLERHWTLHVERPTPEVARVEITGAWRKEEQLPDPSEVWREIEGGPPVHRLTFDTSHVTDWDSGLVTFAIKVLAEAKARGIECDRAGLPKGVQRLLSLAEAVPERQTGRAGAKAFWLARIGVRATAGWAETTAGLTFLGEGMLAFGTLLRGRARFRMVDLFAVIQECGPRALGIVSLISFLIGLILGFVGAVELQQFGASIFVANLVAIAMTREIGCIMTAIVMAGRTGAAFAAQLGTMNTNQEIDALSTMGISPMEFLVLPRMLALILMMPLLTIYSRIPRTSSGTPTARWSRRGRSCTESTERSTRWPHSSTARSRASTPGSTRSESWPSTWTTVSTRWPRRPRPRSRRRRWRSATSGRSSRTCATSLPGSTPRSIRC